MLLSAGYQTTGYAVSERMDEYSEIAMDRLYRWSQVSLIIWMNIQWISREVLPNGVIIATFRNQNNGILQIQKLINFWDFAWKLLYFDSINSYTWNFMNDKKIVLFRELLETLSMETTLTICVKVCTICRLNQYYSTISSRSTYQAGARQLSASFWMRWLSAVPEELLGQLNFTRTIPRVMLAICLLGFTR